LKDVAKPKAPSSQTPRENFFVIGPVGFEESLQQEIALVQPWLAGADGRPSSEKIEITKVRKGGLEISAPRLEGFQLVHHLKSPVRILWRWKSKKISHVSELKSYIRGLRPQEICEGPLELQIQSRKSRLQNEKMLLRVFKEDWPQVQEKAEQTLYIDVYDDQFTFSWDLCGEPLFKRGWTPL
jgi:23S rRNA G2445 N2-methylase RlmL